MSTPRLKIALVGGIFDKPAEYRSVIESAPELTLEAGLRSRGHLVVAGGHESLPALDDIDVVHVHHLAAGGVRLALRRRRPPLVYTHHGMRRFRSPPWRVAEAEMLAASDAVISLSGIEQRSREGRLDPRAIDRVIANGVDFERFSPGPAPPAAGPPWRLLFVGQLIALKGLDTLFRAIASSAHRTEIELSLVHQVDTERSRLESLASQLGVSVRFLGAKSAGELAPLYREAHLTVLPSHTEALPTSLTEAMASACPVLASSVGGIPEQIAGIGELAPPGDPGAWARTIDAILDRHDEHRDVARRGVSSIRSRFSESTMLDEHEALYAEVASRPRRVRGSRRPRSALMALALRLRAGVGRST